MNGRVHEKVLVLFQESFNATAIFLESDQFLLDVFQEVHVGHIKSILPYMEEEEKRRGRREEERREEDSDVDF